MVNNSPRSHEIVSSKHQILVADDDPVTLRMLSHYLKAAGFEVVSAKNGREATQLMSAEISVAIFDLEMPYKSGLDCLQFVKEHYHDTGVLVVSGKGEIADAVNAMKLGALEYITKPFDRDELVARVNHACWSTQLVRDNRGLREAVAVPAPSSEIVAHAESSQQLMHQVSRVVPLDTTVLITGESGTGKTTVARMIHQSGPRASSPFITVNCASLPRELVEAELFGHAKGAFTGATNDRPGRVEIADNGTLFLDEIGDLPLELQPKLLTFLQDRTFQRIGSNKVYSVDVRLIAATHQDLAAMCQAKRFREDLYFRLNVISLRVPSLRERGDDIADLTRHILARIGQRRGQSALPCDKEAMAALQNFHWRGNIRELENVLERASAFCEGDTIKREDLTFDEGVTGTPETPLTPAEPVYASRTLAEVEKLAIIDTLQAAGGNKAEAARRLGISEKGIYNKMKRHEI